MSVVSALFVYPETSGDSLIAFLIDIFPRSNNFQYTVFDT